MKRAWQTTMELAQLDESLLRLLSELVASPNKRASMHQLLVEFLLDAARLFAGDVSRASILVPDQESAHLVRLASIGMPGDVEPEAPFYIGPDPSRKRGIAGEAFVERKARIVHMIPVDQGHWVPDDPSYIESREKRHFPPYRTFVAVPVLVADMDEKSTECLGVLCFDSMNPTLFDRPGLEDSLIILGRRIAAALALYRNLLPEN